MTKNYFELLTPLLYGLSAPKRNLEPFQVPLQAPSSLTPTRSQALDLVMFGFQAMTSFKEATSSAQIAADLVLLWVLHYNLSQILTSSYIILWRTTPKPIIFGPTQFYNEGLFGDGDEGARRGTWNNY